VVRNEIVHHATGQSAKASIDDYVITQLRQALLVSTKTITQYNFESVFEPKTAILRLHLRVFFVYTCHITYHFYRVLIPLLTIRKVLSFVSLRNANFFVGRSARESGVRNMATSSQDDCYTVPTQNAALL